MNHDPSPRGDRGAPEPNRTSGRTWPLVVLMIVLVVALAYQYRDVIPVELLSVVAFLAVCGGMHVFMHRAMGHGGHDHGGHGQAGHRRTRAPHDDEDWPDDGRGVA